MSVTFTEQTQTGGRTWFFSWTSTLDDPTFYVYQDGLLIDITTQTSRTVRVSENGQLQFEVLDSASELPARAFPAHLFFTWEPVAAAKYRVERFVDAAWTEVLTITDRGQATFSYTTPTLADVTTHQYRVVPVTAGGVDGPPRTWAVFLVRWPDKADVTLTWNESTHKINVAVA